ncbi:putative zinc-binding protein [Desulfatirhabdium butyrativorans]|uniref:putative zinc-binding protein n=1 Tax=Desulfatirhabdium butyrativorans TaxID=340467 RepID=UPI0004024576|nr:putative zinc-binding protein [Desulfatirhabdium butyrativorans]
MADCCASAGSNIMMLACSGGSNVGQLSNRAAVELTQEGFGKMFCLAGIGGGISGFVQSAKDAPVVVAIDGCPIGCAKKILANNGIENAKCLLLTELGIEKDKNLDPIPAELEKVKQAVRQICG